MKLRSADIERLAHDYYQNLYRFAISLTHNEAEAADLTQQTYLILAVRGGQIRSPDKAKSWLFTTLYREFLKLKRHSNRHTDIEDVGGCDIELLSVDTAARGRAEAGMVLAALGRIREVFRVPVALYYLDDLNYREIAEILNIPIGTVMSRLFRGKEELRSELAVGLYGNHSAKNVR